MRSNGILLFFQKTCTLQSRGVVTLFHLFTIAMYGRNCFDVQHLSLLCDSNIQWLQVTYLISDSFTHQALIEATKGTQKQP